MTTKFRAAILERTGAPLVVDEVSFESELGPGHVLVRLRYSGVCGAQINEIDAIKGPDIYLPHLLGHEGFGEVVEIGPGVQTVSPGDSVVLHWMPGRGIQSATPMYRWGGQNLNAGWVTTFNEMAVVSENRCTAVVSSLDPRVLPIFGCGATTAAGVLRREAQLDMGEKVVILGAGGVGLLAIIAARSMGAGEIVAVDLADARIRMAAELGASRGLNSQREANLLQALLHELEGPADVIIETTGSKEMIQLAYELAQPGGRAVLVGVPDPADPVQIGTLPLHFGMVFKGSKGGGTKPEDDIPRLITSAEKGIFPIESLPVEVFGLSDINACIERMRSGGIGRLVVACQE